MRVSRVGSHTRTAGGLARAALPYADAAGSEAVQVYVSNSRGWALPPGDPAQDILFRDGCESRELPVYIHAPQEEAPWQPGRTVAEFRDSEGNRMVIASQ